MKYFVGKRCNCLVNSVPVYKMEIIRHRNDEFFLIRGQSISDNVTVVKKNECTITLSVYLLLMTETEETHYFKIRYTSARPCVQNCLRAECLDYYVLLVERQLRNRQWFPLQLCFLLVSVECLFYLHVYCTVRLMETSHSFICALATLSALKVVAVRLLTLPENRALMSLRSIAVCVGGMSREKYRSQSR